MRAANPSENVHWEAGFAARAANRWTLYFKFTDGSMLPETQPANDRVVAVRGRLLGRELPIVEALLCATDHGILVTDTEGQDILCNPQFGRLFGVDPAAIVQLSRADVRRIALQRVRYPEAFTQGIEEAYRHPEAVYEEDIELATEPPKVLSRFSGPVRDCAGVVFGRVWTFRDVTDLRRLQSAVQAYATRVEADAQQKASELKATSSLLAAMTAVSSAIASNRTGSSLIDAICESCRQTLEYGAVALFAFRPDGELAGCVAKGRQSQRESITLSGPVDPIIAKLFSRSTAENNAFLFVPLPSQSPIGHALGTPAAAVAALRWMGQPVGLLCLGVSDLGVFCLPERLPHLEGLAAQITLALRIQMGREQLQAAYVELKQTQDRMVEAAKLTAVGTLAAAVAHDIRNILTPLRIELAASPDSPGIAAARDQASRLSTLTHRMLALASPGEHDYGTCNIRDVLTGSVALIRPQAEIDGVAIRIRLSESLPPCTGDGIRLQHLFINLFLNAICAMHSGGGTLAVGATHRHGGIRVSVADTGPGIPRSLREQVFEPFFTTRANGSGLGLYSVRKIVEEHGGRVEIRDRAHGACFDVWLPAAGEIAGAQLKRAG
jgi:signal transduction histidine kinase/PAS domain-containing protein